MPKFTFTLDIGDILLSRQLLSADALQLLRREVEASGHSLEDLLIERGLVRSDQILSAKSELFDMPVIDLSEHEINREVLQLIPRELSENYQVIAFDRIQNDVSVAVVNPTNFKAMEAVEFMARENKWNVKYFLTNAEDFKNALKQYGNLTSEVSEALTQAKTKFQEKPQRQGTDALREGKLEEVVKSAPVAKMVGVILRHAVEGGASDIHIEPVDEETRVRYRIDGVLHTSIVLPRYIHSAIISRIKVLANLKIDEIRLPQDGRIRLMMGGRSIDFRVSTLPLYNSEKVVLRILDSSGSVHSLEDLGFSGKVFEILKENLSRPHGMFLVTGPTGSGKSTTLFTALNMLNTEEVNIVTLEDPIEYYVDGVNQSQVNPEIGLTFASGLRSILRQDPDVIMVGEIRDRETAELAVHASLTGHIVLSTLHTNDCFGAVHRFMDMHIEPFLIASTLNIIIAQRLVRRICTSCATADVLSGELQTKFETEVAALPPEYLKDLPRESWQIKRGKGCSRCDNTGYRGRTIIAEALLNTPELQAIITAGGNLTEMQQEFQKQGMINMRQDGWLKVIKGMTSVEEVLQATEA